MMSATLSSPHARQAMGELAPHVDGPAIVDAVATGARVTVDWADGSRGHFPLLWLRDHCACSACRHPLTRERLFVPLSDIDEAPTVTVDDGVLRLVWNDGHESRFDPVWLFQRRLEESRDSSIDPLPARRPWAAGFRPVRIAHRDFLQTHGEHAWLEALLRDGLVLLDDGPIADEEVSRLAGRIGPLRATNFGARFDVRSKPNPNNAAYTAIGLALHTDLPNWRQPPDIQLLYCLQNEAEGGESTFADGFAVAEVLRESDPEAFRLLAETPIDFRFQDEEHDIAIRAPVIQLDAAGRPLEIRFNNWIRDTLHLPLERIDAWYGAYRRFWQRLHDPRHQLEFALQPGEMVAFDNRRVLHGRKAFDPSTGQRHLQGTYLDLDLLESRLRVLSR
ncbi:TauD/TfdA family dioxygenase [Modicisalibacter tunisiensis]|uniref:TauD/TfdA family dioxygenase n=1 Tax=Modicisalibacter tunisiensis TaxID=390637 RepID=A0ABS7X1B5_9GAMM|nr:TauD/TfdA family dioxygenase [Modicisalibacter tunisiensis]MBZ9538805.1 TauD/TfdA family dioxygenase [Modicisalibacter tunisiensis]MBZ9567787.1 TauD/TfdA family dioxygenase [Modicisalibacter tunisiensis]